MSSVLSSAFPEATSLLHTAHTVPARIPVDHAQITPFPNLMERSDPASTGLTPTATTSCCDPDVVVVHLQTVVTISNFHLFYPGVNINAFNPDYDATDDGSLLSSALMGSLRPAAQSLLMFGAYIAIFLFNTVSAVGFLFRFKAKDKTIFYALLASQVSALIPWIFLTVGVFNQSTDCRALLRATTFFLNAAGSLVMTGVFGYKAYRCLFSSRIVLVGLLLFELVHNGLLAARLVGIRGVHAASSLCVYEDSDGDPLVFATLVVLFLEAIFIAGCFLYTVWRTSRLLAAQGRISFRESFRASLAVRENTASLASQQLHIRASGGSSPFVPVTITGRSASNPVSPSTTGRLASPEVTPEKASPQLQALRQTLPSRTFRFQDMVGYWMRRIRRSHVVSAMTGSSIRLAFFKPRLVLFREVIRDELCYTTVITAATVVSATFALIGTFHWQAIFDGQEWASIHLGVMSILAVHSMNRTARRHEQERIFQDPRYNGAMGRVVRANPYSDGLSIMTDTIAFNMPTRTQEGTSVGPRTRSGSRRWHPSDRSSCSSQDSSHAMLPHRDDDRPSSWDSTDFPALARRSSYGSSSSQSSIRSIEYLPPPLAIETPNPPMPPDWPPFAHTRELPG